MTLLDDVRRAFAQSGEWFILSRHLGRVSFACVALIAITSLMGATFGAAQVRNYRDRDLHGRDLSRQKLRDQDFSHANLEGADLSFADFSNSILKNANLRGANLSFARFNEADLTEADLRGAETRGATFTNARLAKANLKGLTLYLAGATALVPDYSKLDSSTQSTLREYAAGPDRDNGTLTFQGANLSDTKILGNLQGVSFRGADLRGADLAGSDNIRGANFRGAVYDDNTRWSIDAAAAGAVRAEK